MKEKNIMNKRIGALIVAIAVLIVSVTGSTFAYFALTVSNTTAVTGTTATANLTLSVTEATLGSGNTGKMVPQLGTAIPTAINSTYKCVDGNKNVVCKVYTITVTNGTSQNPSTAGATVNGTITFTNYSGTTNLRWRRIDGVNTATTNTANTSYAPSGVTVSMNAETDLISGKACTPSSSSSGCSEISLGPTSNGTSTTPNNTQTYYIVVWIEETGSDQSSADAGKTFNATIKFEGENGKGITSTITS